MKQLIINPGSTSTKIAVFNNDQILFEQTIRHTNEELSLYNNVAEQYEFRKNLILNKLKENNIDLNTLSSVVGRGGLLKPIESGTYIINKRMVEDLRNSIIGEHASNLGGLIAYFIAEELNIPSFISDPVVVDEISDVARISGHPEFHRICIWHALNQKAVARRASKDMGKNYEDVNLVIAHLGGGVSVAAHKRGRVIDVTNALSGDGPFSPERSGSLPASQLVEICFSGKYSKEEIHKMIAGKGGMIAYLGTNNVKEVKESSDKGNKKSELIYNAMAYQIAKSIGEYAVVLDGDVDGIIITGGIAYDNNFVEMISEKVKFIANVIAYPGEDELTALALGGLRVLNGIEKAKEYK